MFEILFYTVYLFSTNVRPRLLKKKGALLIYFLLKIANRLPNSVHPAIRSRRTTFPRATSFRTCFSCAERSRCRSRCSRSEMGGYTRFTRRIDLAQTSSRRTRGSRRRHRPVLEIRSTADTPWSWYSHNPGRDETTSASGSSCFSSR